jgi:hypothetical protein
MFMHNKYEAFKLNYFFKMILVNYHFLNRGFFKKNEKTNSN